MDTEHLMRVGIAAAYAGGGVLRSFFGRISHVKKKGEKDLVTEADIESESVIIEKIGSVFPNHGILAEESGPNKNPATCQWIIDPLDGTTNFAHRVALFSISIAFALHREVLIGIVLNPMSGELFTAVKGKGARLNGRSITVSKTKSVEDSLLVTGFPYDRSAHIDELMHRFSKCLKASQGMRRLGSAALDLCFVADGRFDGYWEQNLKPWDIAAGALIAAEAGARVTDYANRPYIIERNDILATTPAIHDEMLQLLF